MLEKHKGMPKEQLDKMMNILKYSELEWTIGEKSNEFLKILEDLDKDLEEMKMYM